MSFLNNLVNDFSHNKQSQNQGYNQQQYSQPSYQSNTGPPQVPPPWIVEWDAPANRWIFINRETGQRSFEYPQQSYGGGAGYGGYPQQGGYGQQGGGYYTQEQPHQQSHTGRNTALGVTAGLAGGALLMYEGEKVEKRWDEDKYRMESDMSNADNYVGRKFAHGEQDVEDFPDDAARWTGRKVQEVEDIPENIENRWRHGVQDVEDIPDDMGRWAGEKVGRVERFDDDARRYGNRVEDSYDEGRDERRYEDEGRDERRYDNEDREERRY